jgi:hypothetical protein
MLTSNNALLPTAAWSAPTDGQIQYVGSSMIEYALVLVSLSFTSSDNNHTYNFQLFQNGNGIPGTVFTTSSMLGTTQTVSFNSVVSVTTNDILQVYVQDTTGTSTLTFNFINLSAMGTF